MAEVILTIPRERIRPFADQPREYFDPKALRELAESIKEVGQLTPIAVREIPDDPKHDYELIDGQRRWHACEMVDVPTMRAFVVTVTDAAHQFEVSVVANFNRCGHMPLEIAKAIRRLKEERGRSVEEIAAIIGHSTLFVYQYHGLLRLHERLQERMEPSVPEEERLGVTTAIRLSGLPQHLQLATSEAIVTRRMNAKQAQLYVQRVAGDANVCIGRRNRKPYDDLKVLRRYVGRIYAEAERFLDMPPEKFCGMFKLQPFSERKTILDQLDRDIDALKWMRDELKESNFV